MSVCRLVLDYKGLVILSGSWLNTVRSPNFYVGSSVYERINNKSMWFRNLHALLKLNSNCNYLEID